MTRLVDDLVTLVDIASETGKEGRICTHLAARLLATYGEGGVHRVGSSLVVGEHTGHKPLLLLVGHLDTVPVQGQGPARLEDGRVHGLGSTDMKGGLAVMVHLLEDSRVRSGPYDVVGVFYEGEEGPAEGNSLGPMLSKMEWLQSAVFAVVLEPSDGEIQVGCNGAMNLRVEFLGRAAHSARPWWGENAITRAGGWLAEMHHKQPRAVDVGGLEYREVVSVTRAEGGVANNVIPARFTLNLNYRFTPDMTMEEAERRVMTLCEGADVVEVIDRAPAGPVSVDHPFVAALRTASGADLAPKQGWTDVARLGEFGIPAVNFGPGEASLAHTPGESVLVSHLESHLRALRAVLAPTGDERV